MASKKDMLTTGANKTSKGLFAGMTKLDEKETKQVNEIKEEKKEPVIEKMPSKVKEADEVKESTKIMPEPVSTPIKEEKKAVIEENSAAKEEVKPELEAKVIQQENYSQPEVYVQQSQPIAQDPQVEIGTISSAPVQEVPVTQPQPVTREAFVQPQYQPQQIQPQSYVQPQVQPQAYQQPVYATYQQPITQMPQATYQEPVNAPISMPVVKESKSAAKAEKAEKNSRYEKDKFLLLDIRGLRDYVEHMAKASNMSATKYIRNLIEKDWAVNNDIYQAHKALEERLKERH